MDGSGNACEQGAPTLYGSSSNGQWVLPLPPSLPLSIPRKKAIFPLEKEWADIRLQLCPLMETGFTA